MKLFSFFIFLNVLFCWDCLASPNKVLDESQVITFILEQGKKEENTYNPLILRQIRDFAYQKLRDYAKKDKEFAENLFFDEDEDLIQEDPQSESIDHVGIESFGDGDFLLTVSTIDIGPKADQLYFFLIHNKKSDWIPIQFDRHAAGEGKSRSLICAGIEYGAPLLKIHSRGTPESCGECGARDLFLFKNSSFELIRSVNYSVDLEMLFKADAAGLNSDYLNYMREDIDYTDKDILQLYQSCGPKGIPLIDESELWKAIYFVKSPKVYFYETPDETTKKPAYVVTSDALYISEIQGTWGFAHYRNPKSAQITRGWVKMEGVTRIKEEVDFTPL